MKRILIDIQDTYLPLGKPINSIVNSLLKNARFREHIVGIVYTLNDSRKFTIVDMDNIPRFVDLKKQVAHHSFFYRFIHSFNIFNKKYDRSLTYVKILKRHNFDGILKFAFHTGNMEELLSFSQSKKIPFAIVLVDPISFAPRIQKSNNLLVATRNLESKLIGKSLAYFVPQGWFDTYKTFFHSIKIHEFFFPLINFSEANRYELSSFKEAKFLHLGSINSDRDIQLIHKYFGQYNYFLDVYGMSFYDYHFLNIHERIDNPDNIACDYNFLVLIDNIGESRNYLPSKVIKYISYRKPIIIFGEGNNYTENYISHYPCYFYCKRESDFSELTKFIDLNLNTIVNLDDIKKYYHKNDLNICSDKLCDILIDK